MRVVVRADTAPAIGTGHLARCLTLADELVQRGAEVHLVTRAHRGHRADLARDRGVVTHLLPSTAEPTADPGSWLGPDPEVGAAADAAATAEVVEGLGRCDLLVADGYAFGAAWHRAVRGCTDRIMAIDDLADRPLDVDLLLDQNHGAEAKPYDGRLPPDTMRLLGPRYALVGPAFVAARERRVAAGDPVRPAELASVLVSLGGTDADDVTGRVLASLSRALGGAQRVDVVIGGGADAEARRAAVHEILPQACVHVATRRMAELLERTDLAIGAGGGSAWERLCVGVPTLAIPIAANQEAAVRALATDGYVLAPDVWAGDPEGDDVRTLFDRLLHDPALRRALAERGRTLVDGRGPARVADAMVGAAQP